MRKSTPLTRSRRNTRRKLDPRRPGGRHAPGARLRIARQRSSGLSRHPLVVFDVPDASVVATSEIDVIERHLGGLIDDVLG